MHCEKSIYYGFKYKTSQKLEETGYCKTNGEGQKKAKDRSLNVKNAKLEQIHLKIVETLLD